MKILNIKRDIKHYTIDDLNSSIRGKQPIAAGNRGNDFVRQRKFGTVFVI